MTSNDETPNVRRATAWALGGYAGSQVIRLGGNLLLWRLLHPEAFGIFALVNVFMQGLHMFSDVGIGPSIVQHPRGDDPDYLNTAWTIQVIRGFLLCFVAAALAVPVAHFYEVPELASLLPVVALGTAIMGFISTKFYSARRRVSLGLITAFDLVSQVAGLASMVLLAWWTKSVWSLVAGGLVSNVIHLAFSHLVLPGIVNRFRWERESVRALLHFGRWIFLSTLLTFAVSSSDRLIFGKLVTLEQLGVYSIALVWAMLPRAITSHLAASVVFPLLSRTHNAKGDFAAAFTKVKSTWSLVAGWMAACLVSGGPALVTFFYDERAADAKWILPLLALGNLVAALDSINQQAALAQGRPKWMAASNLARLVGMVGLIPAGFLLRGFPGAVAALAATSVLAYVATSVGLARAKLYPVKGDFVIVLAVIATAFVGRFSIAAVSDLVEKVWTSAPRIVALCGGLAALLLLSGSWFFAWRVGTSRALRSGSAA